MRSGVRGVVLKIMKMRKIHNLKNKKLVRQSLRKNQTIQEVILWSRLKDKNLGYKFRRQQSIGKYVVDFYCPEKKLIVEVDGSQHADKQKSYDVERDKYLKSLGFKVLRFGNDDINNNIEGVVIKIKEYFE